MKNFIIFLSIFVASTSFASAPNPEYFLIGKGVSTGNGWNTIINPQPEKPIYRIYVRNKGRKTAMIGRFRVYSKNQLSQQLWYAISASPDYGVFLVFDDKQPVQIDKIEFNMVGESKMADSIPFELYGIIVPNYRN